MSVENMLPQGSNRMTTTVTPTTSSQTVTPTAGYLFSSVTVNAIPNMTATVLSTKTGENAQLSYTTTAAYKYLVCVASSYQNSTLAYTGTATALINNNSSKYDGDYQHITVLRNASSGVKFTYGANNVGRIIMKVIGFNY